MVILEIVFAIGAIVILAGVFLLGFKLGKSTAKHKE